MYKARNYITVSIFFKKIFKIIQNTQNQFIKFTQQLIKQDYLTGLSTMSNLIDDLNTGNFSLPVVIKTFAAFIILYLIKVT
jgi:hypothetical protein